MSPSHAGPLPSRVALRMLRRRPVPLQQHDQPERAQVVAHRGSSDELPEHTLAAYERALDDGADGLECDVRLTADGHLVCVHDRRVERTSNGRGVVSALHLDDLNRLDFDSWKHPVAELDDEAYGAEPLRGGVLTLAQLLDLVRSYDRRIEVAVEAKHPTRYAGLVERRLVELLDTYGWAKPTRTELPPVRVMSYSWMSLRRVLEFAPRLPTVFLMDKVPMRYRDGTLPLGVSAAGVRMNVIRKHPGYVRRVHDQAREVHVFTVNDPQDVQRCLDAGVDVLITDRPRAVREQLEHAAAEPEAMDDKRHSG